MNAGLGGFVAALVMIIYVWVMDVVPPSVAKQTNLGVIYEL
jgi:hypothetical protein